MVYYPGLQWCSHRCSKHLRDVNMCDNSPSILFWSSRHRSLTILELFETTYLLIDESELASQSTIYMHMACIIIRWYSRKLHTNRKIFILRRPVLVWKILLNVYLTYSQFQCVLTLVTWELYTPLHNWSHHEIHRTYTLVYAFINVYHTVYRTNFDSIFLLSWVIENIS